MTLCPCCGQPLDADREIELAPGGLVSEADAAKLLGLTPSAMQKRELRGKNPFEYTLIGGRRFYRLADVLEKL